MNKTKDVMRRAMKALIVIVALLASYLAFDMIGLWLVIGITAIMFVFGLLTEPEDGNRYYEAGNIYAGSRGKDEGYAKHREEDAKRKGRMHK